MNLDFSALWNAGQGEPRPAPAPIRQDFTPLQDATPADPAGKLPGTDPAPRAPGEPLEGIDALQETGRLKTALLDDLEAGKDLQEVFLTAVDCIGILTQDARLYGRCKELLRKGYGYSLREDLQEARADMARMEKALQRENLTPAKLRIFQRLLDTYREKEKELQRRIDALQGVTPSADLDGKPWDDLTPTEQEKELQRYEKEFPHSVNAVVAQLPYRREQIKTAGQVLRMIKTTLDNIDRAFNYRNSWRNTTPDEILELLERQARKKRN